MYAWFCFTEDTENERLTWTRSHRESFCKWQVGVPIQAWLSPNSSLTFASCPCSQLADEANPPHWSGKMVGQCCAIQSFLGSYLGLGKSPPKNNQVWLKMQFWEPPEFGHIKQKLSYWRAGCCFQEFKWLAALVFSKLKINKGQIARHILHAPLNWWD